MLANVATRWISTSVILLGVACLPRKASAIGQIIFLDINFHARAHSLSKDRVNISSQPELRNTIAVLLDHPRYPVYPTIFKFQNNNGNWCIRALRIAHGHFLSALTVVHELFEYFVSWQASFGTVENTFKFPFLRVHWRHISKQLYLRKFSH